ncbi:putative transposase [Komagataeibacter diospyri]|nr:putative transposase [Komagataeibacter diospyri]
MWDSALLEAALWRHADHLVGGKRSWLIIDDTSLPKKGEHSVGVAPQYASTRDKKANCQTLVSVTLTSREVPLMLSFRLFLPDSWTENPARLKRAGVPLEHQGSRTKPEMAIEEIDRLCAAGVRFGCVLADAGYGLSAPFRQALSARNLCWAVGIPRHQKVCSTNVELVFSARKRGPSRMHPVPDQQSVPAHKILETATWRRVRWRRGTKGGLAARFAAMRIRVADGPAQRIGGRTAQHMPGEEAWLIGEHRSTGERKYYLSNLSAGTSLRLLAAAIKARWVCEQAHKQLREELGLDHFEWAIMDRPASTHPDVHDGLRLSPVPAPYGGRAEKKEAPAHHHSPVCQQYDRPFLIASCDHPSDNARIVETFYSRPRNTFCQSSANRP